MVKLSRGNRGYMMLFDAETLRSRRLWDKKRGV